MNSLLDRSASWPYEHGSPGLPCARRIENAFDLRSFDLLLNDVRRCVTADGTDGRQRCAIDQGLQLDFDRPGIDERGADERLFCGAELGDMCGKLFGAHGKHGAQELCGPSAGEAAADRDIGAGIDGALRARKVLALSEPLMSTLVSEARANDDGDAWFGAGYAHCDRLIEDAGRRGCGELRRRDGWYAMQQGHEAGKGHRTVCGCSRGCPADHGRPQCSALGSL